MRKVTPAQYSASTAVGTVTTGTIARSTVKPRSAGPTGRHLNGRIVAVEAAMVEEGVAVAVQMAVDVEGG